MEREELEIKDVEVSFSQRMKDFFAGAKDKYYDVKLFIREKINMISAYNEYESERLEEENYNKLDLAKKIGYMSLNGIFTCGFASIAIVSAVALTPVNIVMALPLTAVTFGAAWFCKNRFNESKTEFKDMLEKYRENNQESKEQKLEEKEAKKAEKKAKKETKKIEKEAKKIAKNLDKKSKPSLLENISTKFKGVTSKVKDFVSKFKKQDDIYDELDMPELDDEELIIPEPEKIKKSKIDGITINPITKKVTVTGLKIKNRKSLGIYEVILPKDDQIANKMAEELLAKYEKLAEYEVESKKVITLKR